MTPPSVALVTRPLRSRRLAALAATLVAVLQLLLLAGAPAASAHADLVSTTPVPGSEVDTLPARITLTFSEGVGIALDAIRILDGQGKRVDVSAAEYDGDNRAVVVSALPADLPKASYAVVWHVVSADGHPISGVFSFGYGVPAGAAPGEQSQDRVVGWLHWAFTGAWYLGASLLIGAALLVALVWPAGQGSPRIRRLQWSGLVTAVVATVALYVVQGPYGQSRDVSALADLALLRDTFGTTVGPLLLERLVVLLVTVPALGLLPRRETVPIAAGPAVTAALALTAGLGGHSGQEAPVWLNALADAVHFAAATAWLGGLVALVVALLPGASTATLVAALPRWSRLAMGCVAVLVVTGGYQAWREVRSVAALTGTDYGRLLVVKVSGLLILLALAALGRRWVQRLVASRSGGTSPGTSMLRESVIAEVVVGVAVLGLTASLVSTVPARQAYSPPYDTTLFARALDGSEIAITIDVTSTRPGLQEFHVYTFRGQGSGPPMPFLSIEASLSEPRKKLGPLRFSLNTVAPGHGTSAVVVPAAGSWQLTLQVRTDETTSYAATTRYEVKTG